MQTEAENFRRNAKHLCSPWGEVSRIAKKLGVSQPMITLVLQGKQRITLTFAEKFARKYGLSLTEMLVPPKEFRKLVDPVAVAARQRKV